MTTGNYDTIRMVPGLEEMGIRMLLNEAEGLVRGGERIHLVGIDDAHQFRLDNISVALLRSDTGSQVKITFSGTKRTILGTTRARSASRRLKSAPP